MSAEYTTPILAAVVEITNRCNLRCPFCYSASGCARREELTLSEMRRVILDLRSLGCRLVTLMGGELLMRPEWYEIARVVKETGMGLLLVTNGLLVDERIRSRLVSLAPLAVGVSLDGATPETYRSVRGVDGFSKVCRLLNDLISDGIRQVNAITTFNAKNLCDFDKFVSLFIDTPILWEVHMAHKVTECFPDELLMNRDQFQQFVEKVTYALYDLHGRLRIATKDDFGYFPMSPKLRFLCQAWRGCHAGRSSVGIRSNGDVLPCPMLGEKFIEDNLRRRPLVEIWRDPNSFPRFRNKSAQLTGTCAKCPFGEVCKAGCSAMAISQTGTLTETPFCIRQLEQERILKEMIG